MFGWLIVLTYIIFVYESTSFFVFCLLLVCFVDCCGYFVWFCCFIVVGYCLCFVCFVGFICD